MYLHLTSQESLLMGQIIYQYKNLYCADEFKTKRITIPVHPAGALRGNQWAN